MSIGGRIKRVHQLDVLERLDKKNPKLAQEPVLNRRRHAVDSSSSANWMQDGTIVTSRNITLEVGSRITGYVAKGISDWYVLGAEDGKLLITTRSCPEEVRLHGRDGYTNGVEILNNAVKDIYNDGFLADSVRSINVEDVNRVTGYKPENAGYGANKLWQYGNQVTYYWDGTNYPYYSASNDIVGNLIWSHSERFHYPTLNGVTISEKSNTAGTRNIEEITTLRSSFYDYEGSSHIDSRSTAYDLLFNRGLYWLGSPYVDCGGYNVRFGLRYVRGGEVGGYGLVGSYGREGTRSFGLRPVVSLKSEIQLDSDGKILK